MNASKDYTISAVKKAIEILDLYKSGIQSFTVSEIGKLSGMGRSSALRYVYTLLNAGFLEYDSTTEKYKLGIEIYKLGILKFESLDLRKIATKHLQKLADEESMICYIGVRDKDQLAVVDKILPSNKPSWAQLTTQIGGVMQLYSTGIGRLYLSTDSEKEVERYLNRKELFIKITENTIVEKENLIKEIQSARELGYNVNKGENEDHIYGFCAPVYDRTKNMCAGISVCGIDQICETKYNHLCKRIVEVGQMISYEMGFEK